MLQQYCDVPLSEGRVENLCLWFYSMQIQLDGNNDMWDDSALIRAYDDAIRGYMVYDSTTIRELVLIQFPGST